MPDRTNAPTVDVPLMPWERGGDTGGEDAVAKSLLEAEDPQGAPKGKGGRASGRKGTGKSAPAVEDDDELDDELDDVSDGDELDEADDEDDGAEDGEEDEGDGEDEDSDEEDDGKLHKVTLPGGKTVEVTYDELLRGYSRTADYTRKTQEIATQRKELDTDRGVVREARVKYIAALDRLNEALGGMEPDWERLRAEDPTEYAVQWAEWQQGERDRGMVAKQRQKVLDEQMAEDTRAFFVQLEQEKVALLDAIPAWKDEAVAAKERTALVQYAKELGFTDQQLKGIYDHRLLVMLRKAYLFDTGKKRGVEELRRRRKTVETALKPGGRQTDPSGRERKNTDTTVKAKIARDRLRKTGSVEDAAQAILTAGLID